jgi:prepilin-type processing-associated H-X9-DG protein
VLLLPFLGQEELYAKYRFDQPWDSPENCTLADQMPLVFRCPSDLTSAPSQTSYAMIVGPHAVSDGPTARRMDDIKDGPSNTVMVAEAEAGIQWMEPRDLKAETVGLSAKAAEKDLRRETCEIFRSHDSVANVLFCDGSVRALSSESVHAKDLEGLMTIDGGEAVRAGR